MKHLLNILLISFCSFALLFSGTVEEKLAIEKELIQKNSKAHKKYGIHLRK